MESGQVPTNPVAYLLAFNIVFIARQHTDARYWYSNSVRPSVCP